ncbi:DUF6544 family protein [Puia dinghuensis]|uniref:Uncharacterized protein n=1 Tax=Puia dinghuensis TaxID=1792502 RepID=A0A8J2UBR0_9BACT|nr:DUF6544 family protein [Puia dinghuensis]GGA94501.1 hypothetical protein GCM10011511_17250 [Puia dinghuensis]
MPSPGNLIPVRNIDDPDQEKQLTNLTPIPDLHHHPTLHLTLSSHTMPTLHRLYLTEISNERGKFLSIPASIFTEADIVRLPEPVQRYFRSCGYLGKLKQFHSRVIWKNVAMQFSPHGKWRRLQCNQFNSVPEPVRMMHLKTRLGGILPFEARDKYQDGHGNMLIRALSFLTVQDVKGREIDESELVTILSESLLIPAYALQPYIRWSAVASDRAEATMEYNGTTVKGLFFFNNRGEMTRFETYHRWRAEKGGRFQRVPWCITTGDYVLHEGIMRPSRASAAWLEGGNWVDYFRGEIAGIEPGGVI